MPSAEPEGRDGRAVADSAPGAPPSSAETSVPSGSGAGASSPPEGIAGGLPEGAGAGGRSEGSVSAPEAGIGSSLPGLEGGLGSSGESSGSSETQPAKPFRFFAPTSLWNEPIPASEPLDASSVAVVGALDAEVAAEQQLRDGPWINTTAYSVPVYTVPADQPTVKVQLDSSPLMPALQTAWEAVPLPATARPAAGTDRHLVVWQPSTDRLWEFWKLVHEGGVWQASWGGAMQNTSADPGVYGTEAWPGAKPQWGASASSLSIAGGLITLEDLEMGQINHALAITVPKVRAGVYAAPAQRTDGKSTDPLSLPEGARLRLDPQLNLTSLHLPWLTLMIAEAAQRYGMVVRDRGATVAFYAQDPTPTGTQPFVGSGGYFEGKYPNQLLAAFPWEHLQLLQMQLHGGA